MTGTEIDWTKIQVQSAIEDAHHEGFGAGMESACADHEKAIAAARAEAYAAGRADAIADLRARYEKSNGLLLGYLSAAAYLEAKGAS